ncbi:MAG: Phage protein [Lactobacillus helveticus]|uniref:Uncharacterized protein n=2 Tax=Lactobacillus helveticus TaxID=1587 RepID=U4QHH4_LACHE|nr:Protein of unknown function [Lactobacillus helveticus CIRM-BIA 953]
MITQEQIDYFEDNTP